MPKGAPVDLAVWMQENKPLLFNICARYAGLRFTQDNMDELFSEIWRKLNMSVHRYDYRRGKWNTFAGWQVRAAISYVLRSHDSLREPDNMPCEVNFDLIVCEQDEFDYLGEHGRRVTERVESCLARLNQRERAVVTLRFLGQEPMIYEDIGKRLGFSRQRVQQLLVNAMKKMRRAS